MSVGTPAKPNQRRHGRLGYCAEGGRKSREENKPQDNATLLLIVHPIIVQETGG